MTAELYGECEDCPDDGTTCQTCGRTAEGTYETEGLTDLAAGFVLEDAFVRADREDRRSSMRGQRGGPDYFMVAHALRDLGFIIVKKETT